MDTRVATTADTTGQVKRFFTLTILLLGFAVFFWGLHDKLSLYAPPNPQPATARAKLLSQTEQPSARADAAMPQPPRSVPPLLVALFAALLSLLFLVEIDVPDLLRRHVRPKSPPLLPATRLRPPPQAANAFVRAV
jgi:hypothetical protein